MYYGTSPAVDIHAFESAAGKRAACVNTVMNMNQLLLIELTIGALVLWALTFNLLQQKVKRPMYYALLALAIYLFVAVGFLIYLSVNFINRNMAL